MPPLSALPVAAVTFFAAGWGLYYVLIPRLSRSDDPEIMSFLMMYGVSIALAALMLMLFEADSRSIDYTLHADLGEGRAGLRLDRAAGRARRSPW